MLDFLDHRHARTGFFKRRYTTREKFHGGGMLLTQYTDYSLRMMAYLAQLGRRNMMSEITKYLGVSRSHRPRRISTWSNAPNPMKTDAQ